MVLMVSPLQVQDTNHETNLLAKGKPEAGPEDPANEPVVAAILRNPNRMRNAESPSPDIAACSPGPAHVSFPTYIYFQLSPTVSGSGQKVRVACSFGPAVSGG